MRSFTTISEFLILIHRLTMQISYIGHRQYEKFALFKHNHMQVMKPIQRAYQATGRITALSPQQMVAHIFQM